MHCHISEMYITDGQIKRSDMSSCFICAASSFSEVHSVGQSE